MRKLDRTRASCPPCLLRYKALVSLHWKDVSAQEKEEIRTHLQQMQGAFCAYCEGYADRKGAPHVEHFRRKSEFPQQEFDWENLFLSCDDPETCGKHKDDPSIKNTYDAGVPNDPYRSGDILDPCRDDPRDCLLFSADGSVYPRPETPAAHQRRASETIRVLGLDHIRLFSQRKQVVATYIASDPDLLSVLESMTTEERRAFVCEEIAEAQRAPFAAAIRELLLDIETESS